MSPSCYESKRPSSSHLILLDLLPSCTSCLSQCSISCVSITSKRKVYYRVGTEAHNGPLFWLSVVERSLVKHIFFYHNVPSCHFYTLLSPVSLFFFLSPLFLFNLWLFSYHFLFFIICASCWEYVHLSLRLVIRNKTGFSVHQYFGTGRVMIRPSVLFLPVPFQTFLATFLFKCLSCWHT